MARTRTGTSTVLRLVHKICQIVGKFGAADLTSRTNSTYAAAVAALIVACHAFEALDDNPYQIDRTAPRGPEDIG